VDYREAGVDIKAGDDAASVVGKLASTTFNERVLKSIGGFGGFFSIADLGIEKPVLVSSADGIGTKLLVARMAGNYSHLGEDIVNHCINDIACCGAHPMFFLDYFATAHLKQEVIMEIVSGISEALKKVNCPLIGGETAEMPDLYSPGDFDIAGFIVGVVDRDKIIDGSQIKPGDKVIVLPSNGLHTNGFTLARRALFDMAGFEISSIIPPLTGSLAESLLKPHTCYLDSILKMNGLISGLAHITGGGLRGNIKRILPENCQAEIEVSLIKIPQIFELIRRAGTIAIDEMYNVFNMGAGMAVVVNSLNLDKALIRIRESGIEPIVAGEIVRGEKSVVLKGLSG